MAWTQKDIFAFKIQVAMAKGMLRRLNFHYWGRWWLLANMELIEELPMACPCPE